jgi:nitroreductase
MDVATAIATRRSVKKFTDRVIAREEIDTVLRAAVLAPNHRLTQPWRFYVLGPESRRGYGAALGARKARKVEDPEAGRLVLEKVAAEHAALPAVIAVAIVQDDNPEVREEDYAAAMMAVQNLSLAATALGLATHIKTGAIMDDPAARDAVGVRAEERIVALVNLGEPESLPDPKPRQDASQLTTWRP